MDGVLVNFVEGFRELVNLEIINAKGDNLTDWDWAYSHSYAQTTKPIKLSQRQIWDKIDGAGESFWENLEKFPHSDELVNFCFENFDTHILTSPSSNPVCASGKMKSIKKHYPHLLKKMIITKNKYLCAAPGRILVDDNTGKINKFNKFGGDGMLFPTFYNSEDVNFENFMGRLKNKI